MVVLRAQRLAAHGQHRLPLQAQRLPPPARRCAPGGAPVRSARGCGHWPPTGRRPGASCSPRGGWPGTWSTQCADRHLGCGVLRDARRRGHRHGGDLCRVTPEAHRNPVGDRQLPQNHPHILSVAAHYVNRFLTAASDWINTQATNLAGGVINGVSDTVISPSITTRMFVANLLDSMPKGRDSRAPACHPGRQHQTARRASRRTAVKDRG